MKKSDATFNWSRYHLQAQAVSAADESRASVTVVSVATALVVPLRVGRYRLTGDLFLVETAATGLRVTLDGPVVLSDDTKLGLSIYDDSGLLLQRRLATLGFVVDHAAHGAAGTGQHAVHFWGTVNVTTAGTLGIYWAQSTSDPAALIMQSGSCLEVSRIT